MLDAGGVSFIIQKDFQLPSEVRFPSRIVDPNMTRYNYSPMDNYSEAAGSLSTATFDFPANTMLEGMFLGNVTFSRMSIEIRAGTNARSRIGNVIATDIKIDPRDGLHKYWMVFSFLQQTTEIRQIIVTPLKNTFAGGMTRIGTAVFAKKIQVFPQRPRQGLSETVEPEYIRTGTFTYPTGSPKISSRMSFRGSYAHQEEYQTFLRNSAGELLVVIENKLHGSLVEEQQYAYFARRQRRAQTSRGVAFEMSLELVGEV